MDEIEIRSRNPNLETNSNAKFQMSQTEVSKKSVIPVKTGIQGKDTYLASCLRRNDRRASVSNFEI